MKISRRGCGDWMLYEFAEPFIKAKNRQRSRLDMDKMFVDFKKNLMKNANIGGGNRIDIVIKQANGTPQEVDFLSKVFGSEPVEKVFAAREPHGWWLSAKKKFGHSDAEMLSNYRYGLQSFSKLGGTPILYGPDMPRVLAQISLLSGVHIDEFVHKDSVKVSAANELEKDFLDFTSRMSTGYQFAQGDNAFQD